MPNLSSKSEELPPESAPSDAVSKASPFGLDDTFVIDLPPASQLDSSVLEALPQDMKEKILKSYIKLEQTSELGMEGSSSSGGHVQKSPSHLPGGGSRRGRGKGRGGKGRGGKGKGKAKGTGSPNRSPQKWVGVSESPLEKQTRLTSMTDASCVMELLLPQSDDTMHAAANVPLEEVNEEVTSETIIYDEEHFLSEFRAYLKKWVHDSPKGPLDTDLKKIITYFIKLHRTNPAIVFVVFLGLRRLILKPECISWSAAFNNLLEAVQSCIQLDYNGILPVEKIAI